MKIVISGLLFALMTFTDINIRSNTNKSGPNEIPQLNIEHKNISSMESQSQKQISTFLTFQNNDAEEAMNFYMGLFEDSRIIDIQRHGKDGPAKEGSVFVARFELNGSQFMCSDSYIKHEWDFTPGVSIFVDCKSANELEHLFKELSEGGEVMMPLNNYGFSQKFGFVADRFGVSWQLNLQ